MRNNCEGKLEWFGGNANALEMFNLLIELAHSWDDIVDRDSEISEFRVNRAFLIALCILPSNPFYRAIQDEVRHWWFPIVAAYEAANHFEQTGDSHGLEIGHMLRYAAGHIVIYSSIVCLGYENARRHIPDIWKCMACERIGPYIEEHQPNGGAEARND